MSLTYIMNHLKLSVFSKSIVLLFLYGMSPTTKLITAQPRILGGEECIYEKFPFVLHLFVENDGILNACVGSLISMEWILTAAHCINEDSISNNLTYARSGFTYENVIPQIRYVKQGIRYGKYTTRAKNDPRYDIGVMLLQKAFDENDEKSIVKPGKIAGPGFWQRCTEGTASGTGATEIYDNYTAKPKPLEFNRTLNCVDLPIVSTESCQTITGPKISSTVDDSMICTVSKDKKGFCKGDTGGPLTCKGVIIGVNSAVIKCGKPDVPSFSQAVESYLNFIAEETKITNYENVEDAESTETTDTDVQNSNATKNDSSVAKKGSSNKREIASILLIIDIFITLWM